MSAPLLDIRGLQVDIRTRQGALHALRDVTLQVQEGEVLGIVGESGSGKTMTALSVLRLLPQPNARLLGGEIHFGAVNLLELDEPAMRRLRGGAIGMVFQDPSAALNPYLKIRRQVLEAYLAHHPGKRREGEAKALEILESVGIGEAERVLESYPHQLSGGLRQRVMIAAALICSPSLLIADEPTSALDATVQAQLIALLHELKLKLRMSMLLISHDMRVVASLCNRVAVMYAGSVVERGGVEQIMNRPRHPYTRAMIQSLPSLDRPPHRTLPSVRGNPPDLMQPRQGCLFYDRCEHAIDACKAAPPPERFADGEPQHGFRCIRDL